MSDTPASLRRKIGGAGKLETVVRTMKAVAASSIGQYEAAVHALADYERSVNLALSVCLRYGGLGGSRLNQQGASKAVGVIVFGSDQGLVGQFNEAMAEFVETTLAKIPGEKRIWAVGERIYARLADSGLPLVGQFNVPSSVAAITSFIGQVQMESDALGYDGRTEVYVFQTRRASGNFYEPVCQRSLPLDEHW